jgi:hypothetical protein
VTVVQDQMRKVRDAAAVARCWKKVLAWPATTITGYHEPPGEAFVGDARGALERAVRRARQL